MMMNNKCCPYCKSRNGFYTPIWIKSFLVYDFDGNSIDALDADACKQYKIYRCLNCDKTIPKKLLKEIFGEEKGGLYADTE